MKILMVSLAVLLLTVNLIAAPAEAATDQWQAEEFDVEFALPEFNIMEMELPEFPAMERHAYEMLAFAAEDNPERRQRMHKHAERIQLYRLWKIMEDLDLTDDQVDKFFPLMREMGKKEKALARQRHALVKGLREELGKEEPSDSRLKQLLADLNRNARDVVDTKNETIDSGAKILSTRQQARMALELHEVERNIWESIANVRRMPSGRDWAGSGFDKQKLKLDMKQLRENLGRISRELEAKGLPGLDLDIRVESVLGDDEELDIHIIQKDKPKDDDN